MNYLAHALLSPTEPQALMGNIWGDLLRPMDYESLTPGVLSGVVFHKSVDAFTDQHSEVDQIIKLIRPFQGKYTPVVVDVLMDFMLSKFWETFHDKPLEKFCNDRYKLISKHLDLIPERLHPRIKRMLDNRWLESCVNRERMETTLWMLSQRASFENNIPKAMQPYDLH
ncbi:MAG TPA: ACP phosphodiesterase, partial [Saprospiraceae bacterium]|nr:ACP phosphodiesterase [Saprospiraceae bacterium]